MNALRKKRDAVDAFINDIVMLPVILEATLTLEFISSTVKQLNVP
jgi:hypothetical protein